MESSHPVGSVVVVSKFESSECPFWTGAADLWLENVQLGNGTIGILMNNNATYLQEP
jgi:hypothetical protein